MHFDRRRAGWQGLSLAGLVAFMLGWVHPPLQAQGMDAGTADCGTRMSLDQRLIMQQWSVAGGDCTLPVKTRVIDRFLGFTCTERGTDAPTCRSYVPGGGSRAYDTAQFFRCVDLGLTGWEDGITVSRIREWAAPQDDCSWDPGADVLAMEVDLDNGYVCAAALCMPAERLTAMGKVRLKQLIESAFRDLDLTAEVVFPRFINPAQHPRSSLR
jgi:hypothetical protein